MANAAVAGTGNPEYSIWRVIMASSVGTMIEWYDFYIFGSLTLILALKFYPQGNDTFAYLAYLATFAVGFLVRPFGALFFGRIGDLVGRKYAFLVTLSIMGFSTFAIGLLPTFKTAGWFAPIVLLVDPRPAGIGAGRRVWRRCGLRWRARARQQARLLHQLHPDHGIVGFLLLARRDPGYAILDVEGRFFRLRLAHSLPRLHHPGADLTLHSLEDERVAHLRSAQGHGDDFRAAT